MNEDGAWLHHQKLVKTTSSSSIQGSRSRRKAEHLCQVRKLCAHHPERLLKQWPPDRLIDFRPAVYSAIFTVSNVNDS
jgi:hypothetical protein